MIEKGEMQKSVEMVSSKIRKDMELTNKDRPLYICLMDGAVQFFVHATENLPSGYCYYLGAHSYFRNVRSQEPSVDSIMIPDHWGAQDFSKIVIFDDIWDTGATMKSVRKYVKFLFPESDVRTAVAVHRRIPGVSDDDGPDFAAHIETTDRYLTGYGLDDMGFARNDPCIY